MSENRNNFKEEENRKASPYKLWLLHQWNYVKPGERDRTEVYFAFNTKPPHIALKKLIELIDKRKLMLEKAIIYNNKTNQPFMYLDAKSLNIKDWVHR